MNRGVQELRPRSALGWISVHREIFMTLQLKAESSSLRDIAA